MEFQNKLQVLRKQKGMSQEKLAEKIGISRQALAKWEVGQSYPDIDKLIILSDLFGMSIDKLVKDDENCAYEYTKRQHHMNEELVDFLCRAKKATYAGKGAETASSRPKSHDLQYVESNLKYIDTRETRDRDVVFNRETKSLSPYF